MNDILQEINNIRDIQFFNLQIISSVRIILNI